MKPTSAGCLLTAWAAWQISAAISIGCKLRGIKPPFITELIGFTGTLFIAIIVAMFLTWLVWNLFWKAMQALGAWAIESHKELMKKEPESE